MGIWSRITSVFKTSENSKLRSDYSKLNNKYEELVRISSKRVKAIKDMILLVDMVEKHISVFDEVKNIYQIYNQIIERLKTINKIRDVVRQSTKKVDTKLLDDQLTNLLDSVTEMENSTTPLLKRVLLLSGGINKSKIEIVEMFTNEYNIIKNEEKPK